MRPRRYGDAVHPGTLPHAWIETITGDPSTVQLCVEHGPASPHSELALHNWGKASVQLDWQDPTTEVVEPLTDKQQTMPPSPQVAAEVHVTGPVCAEE